MAEQKKYLAEDGGQYLASEIMLRDKAKELTQDEYDALTESEKHNGTTYYITDADPSYSGGTVKPMTWDNIQNKPDFAAVATSGSYNDLTDKPASVTQEEIQQAVETLIESGVVDISGYFKNNLTTTESGYALDARQGKVLNEKIVTSITQDGATFNAKNINGNNLFSFSQPASHTYTVLNGELLQDSLTLTNFTFQSGGLNKVVHGKLCMFDLSANFTMVDDSVKEYAIANIKFPTNLLPTAYRTNRIYRPVFSSYLSGEQLNSSSSPDVFISTDGCVNISTGNRKKTLSGTTYIETLFRCIYILQ